MYIFSEQKAITLSEGKTSFTFKLFIYWNMTGIVYKFCINYIYVVTNKKI